MITIRKEVEGILRVKMLRMRVVMNRISEKKDEWLYDFCTLKLNWFFNLLIDWRKVDYAYVDMYNMGEITAFDLWQIQRVENEWESKK